MPGLEKMPAACERAARRGTAVRHDLSLIRRKKEVPVKKLAIATAASIGLAAIALSSATAQIAPSSRYAQLQRAAAQTADRLSMEAVPPLDQDNIRQVQQALEEKGFDAGPVDGILGPRTKDAVRNFQDRYGMKATGEIDNQTLFALGKVELAGQPGSESDHTGR
jgi:hypothetical protein